MNSVCITISTILLAAAAWLAWLVSKPTVRPLLDKQSKEMLEKAMPEDTEVGNSATTITDFNAFMDSLIEDIDSAEDHVHVQFFKFESDFMGQRLGNALAAKAAEGVEVRLIYDYMLGRSHEWYHKYLRRCGVEIYGFGKTYLPLLRKKDNYRNHRKVVVIDGRVGYLGGMNIASRYGEGLDWGSWNDTMTRIEGPAVAQLQNSFVSDWCYATGNLLTDSRYFPRVPDMGSMRVKVFTSGPIGKGPEIMRETVRLLDESKDYIYFESPYFIPTTEVMDAMCSAARRGVDVRVIIPSRSDRGVFLMPASQSYVAQALKAGVKIGVYKAGFLHSKLIVSDDSVGFVGSTNIDPRSYLLDMEIGARIESKEYAAELKTISQRYMDDSEWIDFEQWQKRPLGQRIFEMAARTIAPQL